eukprot:TRINITY_DN2064_c0_g1_i1.p1 TRINITY_DN2064_c0_g1~~TRINITY_DN2064_c0_g1_i1.p1  ORF type:complete len:1119 (+),score=226.90 TRINITY_DN2064_c0_g1_i1:55-3411(+)
MALNPNATSFNPYLYNIGTLPIEQQEGLFEITATNEPNVLSEPLTCVKYDEYEEMVWTGTVHGRVVSYMLEYGQMATVDKYTSWSAHYDFSRDSTRPSEIRDILVDEEGIVSLSPTCIRYSTRGGLVRSTFGFEEEVDLSTMCFAQQGSPRLYFGGAFDSMYLFDLYRTSIIQEIPIPCGITKVRRGRYVSCGTRDGRLILCDSRSNRIEHTLFCHTQSVTDLTIKGDLVVTCGLTTRMRQNIIDLNVKVFDTRSMRAPVVGITFHPGPSFLAFHPRFSSTLIVASRDGQFQLCDVTSGIAGGPNFLIDTQGQELSCLDISSSGSVIGFGDMNGTFHQWVDNEDITVNAYSKNSVQVVDPYVPRQSEDGDEWSPLIMRGMQPVFNAVPPHDLLSTWSANSYFSVSLPSDPIPPELQARIITKDILGVIPCQPGSQIRNLSKRPLPLIYPEPNSGMDMFSDQEKADLVDELESPFVNSSTDSNTTSIQNDNYDSPSGTRSSQLTSHPFKRVPKHYRFVRIQHSSKIGVLGFDFGRYNSTQFGGLENTLTNSYINSLLQVFYFNPRIRAHCISNLYEEEFSLTCELGFLFHMLDICDGASVEARNLLRALKHIQAAQQFGIFEEDMDNPSYPKLIEKLESFIFHQLKKEQNTFKKLEFNGGVVGVGGGARSGSGGESSTPPKLNVSSNFSNSTLIDNLFGSTTRTLNICLQCNYETSIETRHLNYRINFPSLPSSFASVLKSTLSSSGKTPAWCSRCGSFQISDQKKDITSFPQILSLHCAPSDPSPMSTGVSPFWNTVSDQDESLWGNPSSNKEVFSHWLPFNIQVNRDKKTDRLIVQEYTHKKTRVSEGENVYVLTAVVSCITDKHNKYTDGENLVAQILVKPEYIQSRSKGTTTTQSRVTSEDSWYLFNDFNIMAISKYEAVHINSEWKVPCILHYTLMNQEKDVPDLTILSTPSPIKDDVFFAENPLDKLNQNKKKNSFSQIKLENLPGEGDLVAIDAEFVRIASEDVIQKPGGRRIVLRPVQFSLARVSVLLDNGEPFIDDYISTEESEIQDYLTQYSGLVQGDLDPATSVHHVTTLKHAYLKLRRLADRGCRFVGHGLSKDFQIISILTSLTRL